jgi:uncharacterized protein (DUF2147 family)
VAASCHTFRRGEWALFGSVRFIAVWKMKPYQMRLTLLAIGPFVGLGMTPALAAVDGLWLDKDGTTLRIHGCGSSVCANVVRMKQANDPVTGHPWTDKNNIDPSKRGRPLVGVPVLMSMRPDGPGKWTGQLYNMDDGKTYAGNLIEVGPDAVRIEGCFLGVCGGENLSRIKSTAATAATPATR